MRADMTINEVIPIIESLPHADKFKLMQFILTQLAKEEGVPLQVQSLEEREPLLDLVGMAEGEDADIARNHDKYLYGAK